MCSFSDLYSYKAQKISLAQYIHHLQNIKNILNAFLTQHIHKDNTR